MEQFLFGVLGVSCTVLSPVPICCPLSLLVLAPCFDTLQLVGKTGGVTIKAAANVFHFLSFAFFVMEVCKFFKAGVCITND